MILLNHLQTVSSSKLFLITAIFMIVAGFCPLIAKSVNGLDIDNNSKQSNSLHGVPSNSTQEFTMVTILGDLIGDKLSRAVDDLEISSKDQSLKDVPFLMNVSTDFNGIPANIDLQKRDLAKDLLQRNKDFASIYFVLPNGDIYLGAPYANQEQLPKINFADREWYKGVVKNNQTYISSIFLSASINAPAIAVAVPVYSNNSGLYNQSDSKSLNGYWVGIINLRSLEDFFKSLSPNNPDQFILVDHNGTEFFDTNQSKLEATYPNILKDELSMTSSSKLANQNKLQTFGNFDLIKAHENGNISNFGKANLDDQMVMLWKSIKIKDSNLYVVLITRNDS